MLISGPGLSVSSRGGFPWVGELREAQGHVCSGREKESMPFPTRQWEMRAAESRWRPWILLAVQQLNGCDPLSFPSLLHSSTAVPGPMAISYSCPTTLPPVGFRCRLFTRGLSASLRREIMNSCLPDLPALRPSLPGWVRGHGSFLSPRGTWVTAEHVVATHQAC